MSVEFDRGGEAAAEQAAFKTALVAGDSDIGLICEFESPTGQQDGLPLSRELAAHLVLIRQQLGLIYELTPEGVERAIRLREDTPYNLRMLCVVDK
jgi:hypothetical protein